MDAPTPTVNLTIDGKALEVPQGLMIIEVADNAGITIPRFCYHKKLSVAANCRMCLIEVANSRKPVPACATPVADGMVILTRSPKAMAFQKAVMEFLLINHPLDCPICDQGGECELQDLAMGYGKDVSRYNQGKRSVRDKDIGPLIETDLTRCIHCTRCVRFGVEIAGQREFGMINRTEHMEISTFMEQAVTSELSGNTIDLCPVGALTSKPFQYRARPWEMQQFPSIAPHDALGSNIFAHVRRHELMRVVPRENDAVNEVWLSDRDRFSYEGLRAANRAQMPLVKDQAGQWQEVSWEEALNHVVTETKRIKAEVGAAELGALISPSATLEECFLAQKLLRGLGSHNIDHRLLENQPSDHESLAAVPNFEGSLADINQADVILLVGSYLRQEIPLLNHRVRQASLNGAEVLILNPQDFNFNFESTERVIGDYQTLLNHLLLITQAVLTEKPIQEAWLSQLQALTVGLTPNDAVNRIAAKLLKSERPLIISGALVASHPDSLLMMNLLQIIRRALVAKGGQLTPGANSAGAWITGCVPHRGPAVTDLGYTGKNARSMLTEDKLKAYFLLNVEPGLDSLFGAMATEALQQAELVVACTTHATDYLKANAHVILPISAFAETSGTYVNLCGEWQSFQGVSKAPGETRPLWKVLRVLGNLFNLPGFDYVESTDVLKEIKAYAAHMKPIAFTPLLTKTALEYENKLWRLGMKPIYSVDILTRAAPALQATLEQKQQGVVRIASKTAQAQGLVNASYVWVEQAQVKMKFPLIIDDSLAENLIALPYGYDSQKELGHAAGSISLSRAE